jgi:hypothetical protein
MEKNEQKLNSNLLRNILSYLPLNMIATKYITLNKKLNKLMKISSLEVNKETNYELLGTSNMNKVYCEYDLDEIKKENNKQNVELVNMHFTIQSKDQGWASVNESSSWVELYIREKNDNKILKCIKIAENFREKDYKKTEVNLKEQMKKIEYNKLLKEFNGKNLIIQIVARSMYPGWECYIGKCIAKFQFFSIDLGN